MCIGDVTDAEKGLEEDASYNGEKEDPVIQSTLCSMVGKLREMP